MGFPVAYSELPTLLLHCLLLLGHLRRLLIVLLQFIGLEDLLDPIDSSPWTESASTTCASSSLSNVTCLPVIRYSELVYRREIDSCAVCLHDFEASEEVRRLANCCHVFHRGCIDSWAQHGRRTCPLCRAPMFAAVELASGCGGGGLDSTGDDDLIGSYYSGELLY